MTHRVALLFLTHRWDDVLRHRFERIVREAGETADVFLLIRKCDETGQALAKFPPRAGKLAGFDQEHLAQKLGFPTMKPDALVPGSTHFPIMAFHRQLPDYIHYFAVEFDVEFTGNWGALVRDVTGQAPDFASMHFHTPDEKPDWRWWDHCHPAQADCDWASDRANLRRSFNPVYCLSNSAIEQLDQAHRDGWKGHYEVLLATILTQRGGKIVDLGDYCIGEEQNPKPGKPVDTISTFRWRPNVSQRELLRRSTGKTLFHPVKDAWFFDGERIVDLTGSDA